MGDRALGTWVIVIALALGVMAIYSIHAGLPVNTITLPAEQWVNARMWAPQGWKFFTRDPREARLLIYTLDPSGEWRPAERQRVFGWNRGSRAKGVEGGLLLEHLGMRRWAKCEIEPTVCLDELDASAQLLNISPLPSLCGHVGFVKQEPVPWAWAAAGGNVTMPSKVIRIEVAC